MERESVCVVCCKVKVKTVVAEKVKFKSCQEKWQKVAGVGDSEIQPLTPH